MRGLLLLLRRDFLSGLRWRSRGYLSFWINWDVRFLFWTSRPCTSVAQTRWRVISLHSLGFIFEIRVGREIVSQNIFLLIVFRFWRIKRRDRSDLLMLRLTLWGLKHFLNRINRLLFLLTESGRHVFLFFTTKLIFQGFQKIIQAGSQNICRGAFPS